MYKTQGLKNSRIEVADALRGLAVAGIILFHSVEHFNTFARDIKYTLPCDGTVFNVLQALLSGKMYGIFAILFGLSFFIMRDNQEQKGKDFSARFAWRMLLLFLFGVLNVCFYDGDILITYAVLGLLLIPAGYLNNRWLWAITIILLIQPLEIYSHAVGWHPDSRWVDMGYFKLMQGHDTFCHSVVTNLRYGITVTCVAYEFSDGVYKAQMRRDDIYRAQNQVQYEMDREDNDLKQDMVSLNSLMSKRDNAFSAAARLIKKANDAASNTIGNIGG